MIKFLAQNPENGRKILGMGLTYKNIMLLMEDKPIHFNCEQMQCSSLEIQEVLIFVGRTEEEITEHMIEAGYLDESVIIKEEMKKQ